VNIGSVFNLETISDISTVSELLNKRNSGAVLTQNETAALSKTLRLVKDAGGVVFDEVLQL
jgi:hypothetical protein